MNSKPTFLVAPAVMVVGEVEKKGNGTLIKVLHARPLALSEHPGLPNLAARGYFARASCMLPATLKII
jgi:hypothetical protein